MIRLIDSVLEYSRTLIYTEGRYLRVLGPKKNKIEKISVNEKNGDAHIKETEFQTYEFEENCYSTTLAKKSKEEIDVETENGLNKILKCTDRKSVV